MAAPQTSKIRRPETGGVIRRTRLFTMLDQPGGASLHWIHGPGGSGKTTLSSSYVASRDVPCLWYQIDSRDSDPAAFFHFFGEAARKLAPHRKKRLLHLTTEYALNLPLFMLRFVEDLFTLVPAQSCIVIDNYQDLPPHSPLHTLFLALAEQAPSDLRIMILSREEPPALFSRLLANNSLSRIGWQQLQLDLEETTRLVCGQEGSTISDEFVRQLHATTDGWAAGLVLLLEHYRLQGGECSAPLHQARQEIFDYFASQVLTAVSAEIEQLLLETSLLSRFTSGMARYVTGLTAAQQILTTLCKGNFFITRHLAEAAWYQYHPLFREFLRQRAEHSLPAERLLQVRRRTAESALQSGLGDDAARLAIELQDWPLLTGVLAAHGQSLLEQGRHETVAAWLGTVPRPIVEASGWLTFWDSASSVPLNPHRSRSGFIAAAGMFRAENDLIGELLALAASAEMCFLTVEFVPLDDVIVTMLPLLSDSPAFPAADLEYRVTMSLFNALSVRRPDHPAMPYWRQRAIELLQLRSDIDVNLQVRSVINLITDRVWSGDMHQAEALVQLLRELLRNPQVQELQHTIAINTLAIYAMIAHIALVPDIVAQGRTLADSSGITFLNSHLASTAVVASLSRGDRVATEQLLTQMSDALLSPIRFDAAIYTMLSAWLHLEAGRLETARQQQEEALRLARAVGWTLIEPVFILGLAIIHHTAGNSGLAQDALGEARTQSERNRSRLNILMCMLLEAEISFDQHRQQDGDRLLAEAIELWSGMGNDNLIWWRPGVMSGLLGRALQKGFQVSFVQGIIRSRGLYSANPATAPENWPWPVRIVTLGRFSIERDTVLLEATGKVQKKPLELLKVLISLGGSDVAGGTLCDILWPDSDGDTAQKSFATTLFRLRQMLGDERTLLFRRGNLSLDPRFVWVDTWAFEAIVTDARAAWRVPGEEQLAQELTDRALALYRGEFLPGERDKPWSFALREKLRARFTLKLSTLCGYWEQSGDLQRAIHCYHDALEVDTLSEEFYQQLMLCYHRAGRRAEAINVYERCRKTLAFRLNITPSPLTEEIHNLIKNGI